MQNKINSIIALGVLLLAGLACSFSTANLSEIKFDKDKSASNPTTKFKPADEIFAVTAVNNAGGANKVKFRLLFDDVEGAKSGTVAYKVEKELKTEGSQQVWLNFSVPNGFVPGTYKLEAVLSDESDKELDRKIGTFTVGGAKSSKTTKPKSTKTKDSTDDSDETDKDDSDDEN
ncbi:MAG: hypothetical protein ABI891_15800 [Acidobacteriota bacterium]